MLGAFSTRMLHPLQKSDLELSSTPVGIFIQAAAEFFDIYWPHSPLHPLDSQELLAQQDAINVDMQAREGTVQAQWCDTRRPSHRATLAQEVLERLRAPY